MAMLILTRAKFQTIDKMFSCLHCVHRLEAPMRTQQRCTNSKQDKPITRDKSSIRTPDMQVYTKIIPISQKIKNIGLLQWYRTGL